MPTGHEQQNIDYVLAEVTKGLAATTTLIQTLGNEVRAYATTMTEIKGQLGFTQESVRTITKILTDSNGHSVMTKIAILEGDIARMELWKIEQDLLRKESIKEADHTRLKIRMAVGSAIFGAVISIGLFILGLVLHAK